MSSRLPRGLVRFLVGLTVLLCLGVAGYTTQVCWARRLALRSVERISSICMKEPHYAPDSKEIEVYLCAWGNAPWCGEWEIGSFQYPAFVGGDGFIMERSAWIPRRTYYELCRAVTGQSLPYDQRAWETWIQAHPHLVWDSKQKRLVESKPKGKP